jgi:hypothetical protein
MLARPTWDFTSSREYFDQRHAMLKCALQLRDAAQKLALVA